MRILIADDSHTARRVLEAMLVGWGHEVVACADGKEAWRALRRPDAPRLAILDWEMPGMNGIDVCRALRARPGPQHVFVYLLSARSGDEDALAGLEAGADDYLTKPVNAAQLRVRLRNGQRLVEMQAALLASKEAFRTQALVDPLTEVWNRRAFDTLANKALTRARRMGSPVGLIMIDLDHFKQVNDTWGHRAGDAVLAEVARRVQGAVREGDELARFGGEELVLLLADCVPGGCLIAAERVRREIAREPVLFDGTAIPVTASLGVATSADAKQSLAQLIERADRALYEAKRLGRNRAIRAGDPARGPTSAS